jgi:MYXO-CTERM domain-containing protein
MPLQCPTDAPRRRLVACAALAALGLTAAGAHAGLVILEPGSYRLHNHEDGSAGPPTYGLRLDELINVTPDHDVFTFSFDDDGANVFLELGGDRSIHIRGRVFGGLDLGEDYDPALSGLWEIEFTYRMSTPARDDDDLVVEPPGEPNTGSITPLFGEDKGVPIGLFDYAGAHPFTLRLGDEDSDLGHRGFRGISGWGWLNHGAPGDHVDSSDWLFTLDATPIPVPPAAVPLLGLAAAWGRRSRRRRA